MKVCNEFIIKDLFDYTINNDVDILDELASCNLYIMIDLIMLSNKCSEDEAEALLNKNIEQYGLDQVVEEIAYEVIGKRPDENDEKQSNSEHKPFLDILEDFYNEIQSIDKNLSISEFMNMSTRYMFKYVDGVRKRFVNNKNQELQSQYMNAMMIGNMLTGHLKECPQIGEDGQYKEQNNTDKIKNFFANRRLNNG